MHGQPVDSPSSMVPPTISYDLVFIFSYFYLFSGTLQTGGSDQIKTGMSNFLTKLLLFCGKKILCYSCVFVVFRKYQKQHHNQQIKPNLNRPLPNKPILNENPFYEPVDVSDGMKITGSEKGVTNGVYESIDSIELRYSKPKKQHLDSNFANISNQGFMSEDDDSEKSRMKRECKLSSTIYENVKETKDNKDGDTQSVVVYENADLQRQIDDNPELNVAGNNANSKQEVTLNKVVIRLLTNVSCTKSKSHYENAALQLKDESEDVEA